jgi:amino acid permease
LLLIVCPGIGGTIGTALYVQIGKGLLAGGPGSLFIAFTLWYVLTPPKTPTENDII